MVLPGQPGGRVGRRGILFGRGRPYLGAASTASGPLGRAGRSRRASVASLEVPAPPSWRASRCRLERMSCERRRICTDRRDATTLDEATMGQRGPGDVRCAACAWPHPASGARCIASLMTARSASPTFDSPQRRHLRDGPNTRTHQWQPTTPGEIREVVRADATRMLPALTVALAMTMRVAGVAVGTRMRVAGVAVATTMLVAVGARMRVRAGRAGNAAGTARSASPPAPIGSRPVRRRAVPSPRASSGPASDRAPHHVERRRGSRHHPGRRCRTRSHICRARSVARSTGSWGQGSGRAMWRWH